MKGGVFFFFLPLLLLPLSGLYVSFDLIGEKNMGYRGCESAHYVEKQVILKKAIGWLSFLILLFLPSSRVIIVTTCIQ